jgi:AraC-like DNA-binding protein
MPIFFLSSSEDRKLCDLVGGLLDSMTYFPLAIGVLFAMLQDRRRPLWPVAVMMAPMIAGNAWDVATRSYALLPILYVYYLLMCVGLILYMIRASRQYGRWLRDNFSDLEHKEVWQSFVVLFIMVLFFGVYAFSGKGPAFQYAMQLVCVVLIVYLVWRVETLSDLSTPVSLQADAPVNSLSQSRVSNIGALLKRYCEEPQLYLQYDISVSKLASQIGTNRAYLSKHFALQGTTYNAYINGLRIQHFIKLYHASIASQQPKTAQELAYQSGFRSYSTFSAAFKQSVGTTPTAWMRLSES